MAKTITLTLSNRAFMELYEAITESQVEDVELRGRGSEGKSKASTNRLQNIAEAGYLTSTQVAKVTGLSYSELFNRVAEGSFPPADAKHGSYSLWRWVTIAPFVAGQ